LIRKFIKKNHYEVLLPSDPEPGDLLEAALALASIFALRSNWRVAVSLVWVTNTWGFVDLLNGLRGVLKLNVPSFNLATIWYIYRFTRPW